MFDYSLCKEKQSSSKIEKTQRKNYQAKVLFTKIILFQFFSEYAVFGNTPNPEARAWFST